MISMAGPPVLSPRKNKTVGALLQVAQAGDIETPLFRAVGLLYNQTACLSGREALLQTPT